MVGPKSTCSLKLMGRERLAKGAQSGYQGLNDFVKKFSAKQSYWEL